MFVWNIGFKNYLHLIAVSVLLSPFLDINFQLLDCAIKMRVIVETLLPQGCL